METHTLGNELNYPSTESAKQIHLLVLVFEIYYYYGMSIEHFSYHEM